MSTNKAANKDPIKRVKINIGPNEPENGASNQQCVYEEEQCTQECHQVGISETIEFWTVWRTIATFGTVVTATAIIALALFRTTITGHVAIFVFATFLA